jgi:hypothetical protein
MAGPLGGAGGKVRQRPPPKLETSMVGPLGVLAACPAAATTEVGDVDGGPLGGAGGKVRQRSPPKLKTSMVGPLGGAGGKDRQRPPPKMKDVDDGPPGGAGAGDPGAHLRIKSRLLILYLFL